MSTSVWIAAGLASVLAGDPVPTVTAPAAPVAARAERPAAEEPTAEGRSPEQRAEPAPRRNAIVLGTHAKIPNWASSLTYQRALGRRVSVGAGLEYGYQASGYWHLQGVSETLSSQVWLGRAFHGVFAEGSLTVAHQFLARLPRLSTTALVPGLGLGFRWTHAGGLTLGASAGLRWGHPVVASPIVCTRLEHCTSVRQGAYARITADVGFVF